MENNKDTVNLFFENSASRLIDVNSILKKQAFLR